MTLEDLINLAPKRIKHNNNYYYVTFNHWPALHRYLICLYAVPDEHIDTDFDTLINKYIIKCIYTADLEKLMDEANIPQPSLAYIRILVGTFFDMYLEQKDSEEVKNLQLEHFERWDGVIG